MTDRRKKRKKKILIYHGTETTTGIPNKSNIYICVCVCVCVYREHMTSQHTHLITRHAMYV